VFDKAVAAIRLARSKGFRVTINCTLFSGENPDEVAAFFDEAMTLGIEGIMVSPGYSYHHAPRQDVVSRPQREQAVVPRRSSNGAAAKALGKVGRAPGGHSTTPLCFWTFSPATRITSALPGARRRITCSVWQRPCYLLTDRRIRAPLSNRSWKTPSGRKYGVGRNPACDNCMAHCGFEGTAVDDAFSHPIKFLKTTLLGPRTSGPMAPDLPILYSDGITARVGGAVATVAVAGCKALEPCA